MRDESFKRVQLKRKQRSRLGRASGFTLIEGLTTMGIFIIVVVTTINLYMIYSKSHRMSSQRQKMLSEASFIIEQIAQDIRLRELIYTGNFQYGGNGSAAIPLYRTDGGETPEISGQEKELALAAKDASDTPVYYYFFDGTAGGDDPEPPCAPSGDANLKKGIYKYSAADECQKLFSLESIIVEEAGFFISPSFNPYPDSDGDCLSNDFNGYNCTCSVNSDCYSGSCVSRQCEHLDSQPRVTFYLKIGDLLVQGAGGSTNVITLQTTVSSRIYKR